MSELLKLNPIILELLTEIESVFKKFDLDYYLVGAFARDVQFQSKSSDVNFRKTNDVDLAICITDEKHYNEISKALEDTGSFRRDEKETIKFHYRLGVEVDLIPFGKIENENRIVKLTKPRVFTLQMPGFAEVAAFTEEIHTESITIKTCSIEGLIMLKLISWDDRPQRTHDLTDIDNIIDAYFEWNSDEIYNTHSDLLDKYDVNELKFYLPKISSHVIGRKIKAFLINSKVLRTRILSILEKRANPRWQGIVNGLEENE